MQSTLRRGLIFFVGMLLAKVLGMARSFLLAGMLLPSEYGIWVTVVAVVSYAGILTAGTMEAVLKQVPFLVGAHRQAEVETVERAALGSTFVSAASAAVLVAVVLPFLPAGLVSLKPWIVLALLASVAVSYFSTLAYFRLQAHQDFGSAGLSDLVRSIATLLLQLAMAHFWGLAGAVLGFAGAELVVCVFTLLLTARRQGWLTPSWHLRDMLQLVRIGLPITFVWWAFALNSSIDRLISTAMLGETQTGYYGLGVAVVSVFILIPQALGRVLYPRFRETLATATDSKVLDAVVLVPSRGLAVALPVLIGLIYQLLPIVFRSVLPAYSPGLSSAGILIVGAYFSALIRNAANTMVATDRQVHLLKMVLVALAINLVGNVISVKIGWGLDGIALCTGISSWVLSSWAWHAALGAIGHPRRSAFREVFALNVPIIICAATLALETLLVGANTPSLSLRRLVAGVAWLTSYVVLTLAIPMYREWWRVFLRDIRRGLTLRDNGVQTSLSSEPDSPLV